MASSYPSTHSSKGKKLPAFRNLVIPLESPVDESTLMPTDYRTTIHFLTSPSPSTATAPTASGMTSLTASAMDIDTVGGCSPNSVPVSALLSSSEALNDYSTAYHSSASSSPAPASAPKPRNLIPLPSIQSLGSNNSPRYRDDEIAGMAGLMELAGPDTKGYGTESSRYSYGSNAAAHFGSVSETNSSRSSSNSTSHNAPSAHDSLHRNVSSFGVPHPSSGHQQQHHYNQQQLQQHYAQQNYYIQQQYQQHQQRQQQQQQQHHQQQGSRFSMHHHNASPMGLAHSATHTSLTSPNSTMSRNTHKATRSFPATIDDVQVSRRRSQSTTDSAQHSMYSLTSALPCVLGNANIRTRSYTQTQRQRTSDTPLFPILLYRIINDENNEEWIRWCEDGQAFKFSSADNLLSCLQAAGLRAQNYHSIEKNLNDYRFTRLTDQRRKIPDPDGKLWWMFSHQQFLRDSPDGIISIQRRRRTNPPAMGGILPPPPPAAAHPMPHPLPHPLPLPTHDQYSLLSDSNA
ncbi:hypothetical protein LPJ66_000354, partial [Kickxella alabastrina]